MKQQGVALIQVLLIVLMITLLVIELSKYSGDKVELAIELKQKSQEAVSLESQLQVAAFNLLTLDKERSASQLYSGKWNLYGNPFMPDKNVELTMQDLTGLISLPYDSVGLLQVMLPQANLATVTRFTENLILWQGLDSSKSLPAGWRGALMQYPKEVSQVPGWLDNMVDENEISILPLRYFNPYMSPDSLLMKLAKPGQEQSILSIRGSTNFDQQAFLNAIRSNSTLPSQDKSDFISVRAQSTVVSLSRGYIFELTPLNPKPLRRLGTIL